MFRRAPLATAVGAVLLVLSAGTAAAAQDPRTQLVTPPGSGWTLGAGQSLTREDVVQLYDRSGQARARSDLSVAGYQDGYETRWVRGGATPEYFGERAFVFGSALGSSIWFDDTKLGDVDSPEWKQTYDTSDVPGSFGGYWLSADGWYNTVVQFARGDEYYRTEFDSRAGPNLVPALAAARQIYARAPDQVVSSNVSRSLAIFGFTIVGAIVLVAGIIALVIWRTRPRPGAAPGPAGAPAGPQLLSPDGRWWWDGREWRPTAEPAPTPPASPAP